MDCFLASGGRHDEVPGEADYGIEAGLVGGLQIAPRHVGGGLELPHPQGK
jgi:hypothetical protein